MNLKDSIDISNLPKHIAIIMDGNGRWAKKQGKNRIFGHKNGVTSVREVTEACAELGVKYLTLYAFSTENWKRPKFEISALMELLLRSIRAETKKLNENGIRLKTIGNLDDLPKKCKAELLESMEMTKSNTRMDLVLALSYSGRYEISDAVRKIAKHIADKKIDPDKIDEKMIEDHLFTKDIPDPELLIRTSGEQRISNFLLWQIAYAELYFTDTLWPDFRRDELYKAIIDFQKRERRFGKTGDQINSKNEKLKIG